MALRQKLEEPLPESDSDQVDVDESGLARRLIAARRRKRRILQGGLLIILLAFATVYFQSTRSLPSVEVIVIEATPAERILAVTGRVQPRDSVAVVSRVAGQLIELLKDEGDKISQGELLGRIDDARARAALAQAVAAVEVQRRIVEQAANDLKRSRALRVDGTVSEAALESATLALTSGREDLRRLEAAVDEARADLDEYLIFAPLTGRILARPVDLRQVVTPATEIFTVAPTIGREVETEVDEAYSMGLTLGQPARMQFAGIEEPAEGTVSYLAPRIDTTTGGRLVRLKFQPPKTTSETELPVGLSVDVNIIVESLERAITLSRSAIREPDISPYVYVIEDGSVARRAISFRDWPSSSVIVEDGLESGDQVVVSPAPPALGTLVESIEAGNDGR
jgi:RND family efflux transporter MFP subunit